jgi:hypothetical protein
MKAVSSRLLALVVAVAPLAACQEHAEPSLTPGQKKKVEAHLLSQAPTPKLPLGAVIEDQVKLVGVDVDKTEVAPGDTVTVTWYIEGLADKPDDNMIFVHFQGRPNDRKAWMNLDHHPIEGLFPLRKLKKGQVIKDVQTFTIKDEFPGGEAKLYWGLWRGEYRLKIKNPDQVANDGDNRVIAATFKVKGDDKPANAAAGLPTATARKLPEGQTLTIDGKLDEAAWDTTQWTPWWTSPDGKNGAAPRVRARFLWDDAFLYVAVQAPDEDVWSTFTDRDSNTWEQEVIELFIDADGDQKDYLELQVTPANVVFDAKFERHRSDLAKARAWNMAGLKTGAHVDGTLNARDDRDRGYTVEMAVPVAEVPGAVAPIAHGQTWRANLFRWDFPKGGRQMAAAFSPPVVGDFHALNKFGTIQFVDPVQARLPAVRAASKNGDIVAPSPVKLDPAKLRALDLKKPGAPTPAKPGADAPADVK